MSLIKRSSPDADLPTINEGRYHFCFYLFPSSPLAHLWLPHDYRPLHMNAYSHPTFTPLCLYKTARHHPLVLQRCIDVHPHYSRYHIILPIDMTSSSSQRSGPSIGNSTRSNSFLQQILDEINGRGDSDYHETDPLQIHQNSIVGPGKHTSSVWVGGATMPQGARAKSQASDETYLHKTSITIADSGPLSHEPSSKHVAYPRLTVGGLRLPSARFYTYDADSNNTLDKADSPLLFGNIDSDISSTPSPTEAPTSAATAALTEATSVSEGISSSRIVSRANSRNYISLFIQ